MAGARRRLPRLNLTRRVEMAKVFICTGKREGRNQIIADRYKFVDGVMVINDDDEAKVLTPILCGFYACKIMDLEKYELDLAARAKSSAAEESLGVGKK